MVKGIGAVKIGDSAVPDAQLVGIWVTFMMGGEQQKADIEGEVRKP